ncbi:YihY/virulence factor BrkB family protein [Halovenus sp. WSH3]|uniref:YihY/virulence factor BrkB family protein n=1 Tax=Halovenus carboxidivorans TaxID=2692199 RepID=A0A6B0TD79_9EURY|nr:YihY/virulence factor BrkB family protein [Halovenus carboxidivorans]MXR51159.1 YihY/virulence factor BrkB family protein [Halovenus carboxidivorans]
MDRTQAVGLLRRIVALAVRRDISFLAGSIAFFAFLSLIPATLLIVAVGSLIGGEQFAARVVGTVGQYLSAEGSAILTAALTDASGLARISLVGALLLLWSTLKVIRAIDIAFDKIYRLDGSTPLLEQIQNGLVVLVVISVGAAGLGAAQVVIGRLTAGPVPRVIGWLFVLSSLGTILLPLYYLLPPVRRPVLDVLPGTAVAVIGLVVLRQSFELYAVRAGQYQAYGAIGAVVLFLLWLYFGALILVVGAVVNAAIAE